MRDLSHNQGLNMFRAYKCFLPIILISLYLPAFCMGYMSDQDFLPFNQPLVATLSAGPTWQSNQHNKTINLLPGITKTYTVDKSAINRTNNQLFLGINKPLTSQLQSHLGLEIALSQTKITGEIWDEANPAFNNYDYYYLINHSHLNIKGKLLANFNWPVQPWISAGMGLGFNRSSEFNNTPSIFGAVTMPNFSSKTVTAFTYNLGLGAQYILNKNWQVGMSYEFADWGKSKLGSIDGIAINQSLSRAHNYSNSFLLNITYLV